MAGMSITDATRRLISALQSMLDKKVTVILTDGRRYDGVLAGFDHPSLNIVLSPATDAQGNTYPTIIIRGERISELMIAETPLFDPKEFAEYVIRRLNLRRDSVKVIPEANAVQIYRIKVSEKGVEGSGAMAQTIYEVFEEYMKKRRKELGIE